MTIPKNNEHSKLKDIMNSSIEESIEESYANYGGSSLGSGKSGNSTKYTPANVTKATPLRHRNPAVKMGQSDFQTQSPNPLIYPFESIFSELVELYSRLGVVYNTVDEAREMDTLSPAKRKAMEATTKELAEVQEKLHNVIKSIEEVTI